MLLQLFQLKSWKIKHKKDPDEIPYEEEGEKQLDLHNKDKEV